MDRGTTALAISGIFVLAFVVPAALAMNPRRSFADQQLLLTAGAIGNAGFFNAIEAGVTKVFWWQLGMNILVALYIRLALAHARKEKLSSDVE